MKQIILKQVELLKSQTTELVPVPLTEDTVKERKQKVLSYMKKEGLDVLVIYGDLEHGSNFEYLVGFLPRFEESILVLHGDGRAYLMLGNENLNKAQHARIEAKPIHVPFFSLPNQPMEDDFIFQEYFRQADIQPNQRIGVVGWKLFTSKCNENHKLFDIPFYILQGLIDVVGMDNLTNCAHLMIGEHGVRTINNANEVAHYEFFSVLASNGVSKALECLQVGRTEMEIGSCLESYGQQNSVVTIGAFGERFEDGNLYPTNKKLKLGDKVSLTVGYRGGLTSCSGYAVEKKEQMQERVRDWLDVLAKPYFHGYATWLKKIKIGMEGGKLYSIIDEALPKEIYHWGLCPGHLIGEEEWLASPIYKESKEILKSGMLLQIDIIPGKEGYGGVGCESGILLANRELQEEIEKQYPDLYERFMKRRKFILEELNIELPEEVFPMNDSVACYSPYMLKKNRILAYQR